MSIFAGILGRRQRVVRYRTIDGGHPAPYPDMTDEQLYNYETTFNVPHRTFTQPPRSHYRAAEANYAPRAGQWSEPVEEAHMAAPSATPAAQVEVQERTAEWTRARPERLRRNSAFDAPRYTRKTAAASAAPSASGPAAPSTAGATATASTDDDFAIDFTRPVRTITTKQTVDVITTRARHPIYKVHAYIGDDDVVTVFTLDGRLCENGPRFLENAPEMRQVFLNIYAGAEGGYRVTEHATRDEADQSAETGRLVCVAVQREA